MRDEERAAATARDAGPGAPQVSVIMAAHDAEVYVGRALRSLQAQTLGDFEVIVVDDASTDGTAEAVRTLTLEDPRIRLLRLTRNAGAAAARNLALQHVRAPLVAVLDADDVAWPGRLEAQVDFLSRHPEVDVVGGQIRVVDGDGRVVGRRRYPLDHAEIVGRLPRADPLAHSTVTARTRVLRAAGGYPPLRVSQDYALWCELARRGARFANLPAPLCDYRIHTGSMKRRHTHEALRRTIAIQQRYWPAPPTPMDAAYRALELLLLLLPPAALNALFEALRYRRPPLRARPPTGRRPPAEGVPARRPAS